ncbi:hypothetical protein F5Y05DRAFT_61583 [Hypoxylon sp. FL0543]|nr:hypothetical protein F5Y05DRAFT_61583 [Hypoxylon sp. FL0543]
MWKMMSFVCAYYNQPEELHHWKVLSATFPLSSEDVKYGLAQCALNQQRPIVDKSLASSRLAALSKTGPRTMLYNATLVDGDGTATPDCTIEIQDGTPSRVPRAALDTLEPASPNDKVINLPGRVVTPGLIDAHSHVGVRETPQLWATEDVTEISAPVTPWERAIDAFKSHGGAIPVVASGGVTTSLVITGAKNQISGEGVVVKMKRADYIRDMLLNLSESGGKPQRHLKMAMGENQKRQFEHVPGGPSTRLGESYWFRKAYDNARRSKREQDRWCDVASTAKGLESITREYPVLWSGRRSSMSCAATCASMCVATRSKISWPYSTTQASSGSISRHYTTRYKQIWSWTKSKPGASRPPGSPIPGPQEGAVQCERPSSSKNRRTWYPFCPRPRPPGGTRPMVDVLGADCASPRPQRGKRHFICHLNASPPARTR